jgi:sec-independent protein translocase protein TatA
MWQLLIVLGIALLIFGTSRLKTIGTDLGGALKGFRKAMEQDDRSAASSPNGSAETPRIAMQAPDGAAAEQREAESKV